MTKLVKYFQYEDCIIRLARDRDIDDLVSLINEAYFYQDAIMGASRTSPLHLRKRVSETQFYIVESNKRLIACVYLEPKGNSLHFGLLTVIPDFRGKGLAQAIMTSIEQYAEDEKYESIELDYMSIAPWLKEYYEKYGFRETGEVASWGSIDLI